MKRQTGKTEDQRIAAAFVRRLREYLTADQWEIMRHRNREQTDPGVCHSHDFCDANMVMLAAFEEVTGREPEFSLSLETDGPDADQWNRAWELAKPAITAGGERARARQINLHVRVTN